MKTLRSLLLFVSALLALVFTSGCIVAADRRPAHPSWPKPVAAGRVQQFDGVYRNQSRDDAAGKPNGNGDELFRMLTGQTKRGGTRVEIRSMSTGEIHLRLLDETHRTMASAELRRGAGYTLSGGALSLHRETLGWEGGSTNVGAFLRHSTFRLHLAEAGGLLGRYTEGGEVLMAFFIPMTMTEDQWMFWPKLSP